MATAAETAYETIRAHILDGTFAPGTRLKEADLVAFCGVSRTPVREALRRLAAEDFVQIQRNQGAEVKAWSDADLDDLFELRALLEGHAASRAARRINVEQTARIRTAIAEMDAVLASAVSQEQQIAEFLRLNRVVHETVWEAAGSERLVSMLGHLVEQALLVRTARAFSPARISQSHRHHQELLEALRAGDEVWAEALMRSHIRAARSTLKVVAG